MVKEGDHLVIAVLIVQLRSGGNGSDELGDEFAWKKGCLRIGIDLDESDFVEVCKLTEDVELDIFETHLFCGNLVILKREWPFFLFVLRVDFCSLCCETLTRLVFICLLCLFVDNKFLLLNLV